MNTVELSRPKFKVGDKVAKPEGYPFPGEVLAVFLTKTGNLRYVVENDCGGLLHIFNETQLRAST